MNDLRGWWDRTRRRKLKSGVQGWVDKVRPTTPASPADPVSPVPAEPIAFPARPAADVPEPVEAAPAPVDVIDADAEVALVVEDEAASEPEAEELEAEAGAELEAVAEREVAPDPEVEAEALEPEAAEPETEPGPAVEATSTAWWETETIAAEEPDEADELVAAAPEEPGPAADVAMVGLIGEGAADGAADATDPVPAEELTWAAPGAAPWEAGTAGSEPEPEILAVPEPVPAQEAELQDLAEAEPGPVAASAPETQPAPTEDPSGSSAEAGASSGAADPWAGITWSAADQPAPWSDEAADAPAPAAPASEPEIAAPPVQAVPPQLAPAPAGPLGLDEDQRRWLDRNVELVEGIGSAYGRQLESVGITTLLELLLRGATRRGRQEIADRTGISGKLILRWVNNADLFRIRGVGTQYADLLEAAGVDTVVELALRRPENLVARLQTTNEIRSLVRQVPSESQVADWVAQAKELPRIVAY